MLKPANEMNVRHHRNRYTRELEQDDNPERLRERLAGMAHALQATLSLPSTEEAVPHASALEVLMRAVGHDIEGDPDKRGYVRDKLRVGTEMLNARLPK